MSKKFRETCRCILDPCSPQCRTLNLVLYIVRCVCGLHSSIQGMMVSIGFKSGNWDCHFKIWCFSISLLTWMLFGIIIWLSPSITNLNFWVHFGLKHQLNHDAQESVEHHLQHSCKASVIHCHILQSIQCFSCMQSLFARPMIPMIPMMFMTQIKGSFQFGLIWPQHRFLSGFLSCLW